MPRTKAVKTQTIPEPAITPDQLKRVTEWLSGLGSHDIYPADALAADYIKVTGLKPCWATYTEQDTLAGMRARGLGGHLNASGKRCAYGYVVADALASKYVAGFYSTKQGRGSRFFECLEALQAASM